MELGGLSGFIRCVGVLQGLAQATREAKLLVAQMGPIRPRDSPRRQTPRVLAQQGFGSWAPGL